MTNNAEVIKKFPLLYLNRCNGICDSLKIIIKYKERSVELRTISK